MRTRLSVVAATLLAFVAGLVAFGGQPAHAATGFTVANGKLYDANGVEFVMRGVNHAHTWYAHQTRAFADIKALGANTVRVVLASGHRWPKNDTADVANVVSLCKQHRLICVLEVHDTTGYGEQSGAATLDQAVDYWISVQTALTGEEKYVIVNIGNEPYGNQNHSGWAADTAHAIQRLRSAGFTHTLMVDGPNWGQDWTYTMRDNAASVFAADPARNTVFSIHMYGVYDTAVRISDYLDRFRTAGLPIVVGEFGHYHSDGDPDEDAILAYAQANGIGYLGWSWSGNGGGVEYLDMAVDFDPTNLSSWGERIFHGANGIRQTARQATVYDSIPPTSPPPSTPPPSTPPPGGCTATYQTIGSWQGGFQGEVTVTAGAAPISGWTVTWQFTDGQMINQSWNAIITTSGTTVIARNVDYNGSLGAGERAIFGFLGSAPGGSPTPTLTCTAS